METSLAQQLRKLKTPQTSALVDSKKRASILFDEKEAAEKDRETIFDIGYSGLVELITLNPAFMQFESVLFDKNARDLQRAVENKEVNEKLNQIIKKFLIHLSPHLLSQPAHKCLEWLIRRFNINEYNKDEMMMLILPYYETKIFVRCIQTMRFNNDDKWFWLKPIQRPGVPLSKTALMNRVASDSSLMKFICESILYAVDQLDTRANTLQAYYAFFTITLIGALEVAKINESHINNIYFAIRKGLKSTSLDFCASCLMVVGQLMTKAKLKSKIVSKLITLLLSHVQHPKLQQDVLILLIVIYSNQQDTIQTIPDEALDKLSASKWIPSALAAIYSGGVNILPLYIPMLTSCLARAQAAGSKARACRRFSEILLAECFFKPEDAKRVIRCALDAYVLPEKDDVIEIASDNEDEPMGETSEKQFRGWYTERLKGLERRYSNIFDSVIKAIITSDDKSISESKKKALKTVLSFLFTVACSGENVNLFEQLYHYDAQYRIEAMRFLVQNIEKMSFSDDSKSLLKDSIGERISDDSPEVVNEVLRFSTSRLQMWVGQKELQSRLMAILRKTLEEPSKWEATATLAIKHLTTTKVSKKESIELLVVILPLLLQPSGLSAEFIQNILRSSLANQVEFIESCRDAVANISDDKDAIFECILQQFENKAGLPSTAQVIEYIKRWTGEEIPLYKAFYSMLLLTYSINDTISDEVALDVLGVVKRFQGAYKLTFVNNKSKWTTTITLGTYPVDINVLCIKNLIDAISWKNVLSKFIDFSQATAGAFLLHEVFDYFITAIQKYQNKKKRLDTFTSALNHFYDTVFAKLDRRVEFLSNYYVTEVLAPNPNNLYTINISCEAQTFIIRQLNATIEENITEDGGRLCGLHTLIRILSGLRSAEPSIREASFDTLEALSKVEKFKYSALISKLRKRQSEILLDENQLPLILFTIFKKQSSDLTATLKEFFTFTQGGTEKNFLIANLLEILTHVNTEDILKSTTKPALNILNEAVREMQSKTQKVIVLDKSKSIIVRNVLSRYTQQTVHIVKKTGDVWKFLLTAAAQYGVHLKKGSKEIPITCSLVDVLNNELFNQLSVQHQREIVAALVNSATYSESIDLPRTLTKYFRQLEINAKVGIVLLNEMANCQSVEAMDVDEVIPPTPVRRRSLGVNTASNLGPEILRMKSWKCGTTWLEYLQNKQKIIDSHLLIPPLFDILQKCLQFEDQSSVEYVKQLVLSCLHDICVTIAPNGQHNTGLIPEQIFKIEPVVQCIRGTQNPQTHHHALRLLAHSAQMLPDQVLHNMMDIFTFMGSSVVRHDDAYSFQIITHIIEAIVPILTRLDDAKSNARRNELVIPVLKVFADIILDVPEHRRLPLYTKLLDTIGANEYLWMFLVILFESHVLHHTPDTTKKSTERTSLHIERPQRVEVALALTKEFNCDTIVIASTKLISFLHKMPTNKPVDESEKIPNDVLAVFNVNSISKKQYRHFKYETIKFINTLTSSVEFVNKVVRLDGYQAKHMKELYQEAIITMLTFIPTISKATEQTTENVHVDYWKAVLHNCFDTLENIISLLSPNVLLVVVHGLLMKNQLASVRRRVIELLVNKLARNAGIFSMDNEAELLNLIDPLTKIVQSMRAAPTPTNENISIQQMAMMAIKLLSKHLAEKHPGHFKPIMDLLIDILRQHEQISRILMATSILSFAEISCNLRVRSIVYLPSFMKLYVKILEHQSHNVNSLADNLIISAITALLKIVSTLANYLSPYLTDLIVHLSILWQRIESQSDIKGSDAAVDKLNGIWEKLATTLELRVLIPTIDKSYNKIISSDERIGIKPVMQLLSSTFQHNAASSISAFMPDITSFFVGALQYRSNTPSNDLSIINATEDAIIKSFSTLTLKLSEGSFRPLYHQIYECSMRNNDDNIDRIITYFRLSSEIAKSLKSLFVLFATEFIDDAARLLTKSLEAKPTKQLECQKAALLVQSILDTLGLVFLYDSRGFINEQRFGTLLQPLVDQIENEIVLDSDHLKETLSSTLAQLGVALNDDIRWKQLNYQLLMKTRHNEYRIRLYALRAIVALAGKLGDDYTSLMSETLPVVVELLEDERTEKDKICHQSVRELEKITGVSLEKYLN